MSTARHHAEWLSLIEIGGPFLSLPVLLDVFPNGLDKGEADRPALYRDAYDTWRAGLESKKRDIAGQTAWIRSVLTDILGFTPGMTLSEGQALPPHLKAEFPEQHETLRPEAAIVHPAGDTRAGTVRLLFQSYAAGQDLEGRVLGRPWAASPATRMMELLHASGVALGLVTNGERWMLVYAPLGETTAFVSWYADYWFEEPITLRAFRALLGIQRFFGESDDRTLEALLARSKDDQYAVTDQLGLQVRRAVEVLIQAIDRADQDRGRRLIGDRVSTETLYEAALTVMMRLVFLFSAEERGLLLLGDAIYDQNYAVSTLSAQLRETADRYGEEVLERRSDAWVRLLATFRAVYTGIEHETLRLPGYGGDLFDPDRFPFLEGRTPEESWAEHPSDPLPVNNRVILHLLEALQILRVKVPGGGAAEPRRLSFRALDIEQIGHVYESLLDHTAVRAVDPVLGLKGSAEPEISVSRLEAELAKGRDKLVALIKEQSSRGESAIRKDLDRGPEDPGRIRAACGNDEVLFQRIRPFAGLIRGDDFGQPIVITAGSVYVTAGIERRRTGAHYTPRALTEPIVARGLEPLVYVGVVEGKPKEEWSLKTARELLALKVCDPAMGSGGFLVQTCRYLAERLVEAWEVVELEHQGTGPALRITPEGEPATGAPGETLIPVEPAERVAFARRIVADRCLYGVDKNPLAVEMAKLSLWLITLAKDKPFSFLDHALRCGDSLIGGNEAMLAEWAGAEATGETVFSRLLRDRVALARAWRRDLESFEVRSTADARAKRRLLSQAEESLAEVRQACDWVVGTRLLGVKTRDLAARLDRLFGAFSQGQPGGAEAAEAEAAAQNVRAFHWPFEFPEVFENSGFDAFVGNPPFVGGKLIKGGLGAPYLAFLKTVWPNQAATADLCTYFFRRAFDWLKTGGTLNLIATNTIAQGDTREVGLDEIARRGGSLFDATPSQPWPGLAAVVVSVVHILKGEYRGERHLAGQVVSEISTLLDDNPVQEKPKRLAANQGKSFIGSFVLGMGFVLDPAEAESLIAHDPRNKDVLLPYLNGEDLNQRPDQSPSRWVINFFDWPHDRASAPEGYEGPVAADYPDCLAIVEERVKPERTRRKENGEYALRKPLPQRWWHYADKRPGLYTTIRPLERVLACALVSKHLMFAHQPVSIVFSHACGVIADSRPEMFAVLQSGLHESWARAQSSTMKRDLRYTPTDSFETFPLPPFNPPLAMTGAQLEQARASVLATLSRGLTDIYNAFHDRNRKDPTLLAMREAQIAVDRVVCDAYGWSDLDLGHGFHATEQGDRWTLSTAARREVVRRLYALNLERSQLESQAAGPKSGARRKGKNRGDVVTSTQPELF